MNKIEYNNVICTKQIIDKNDIYMYSPYYHINHITFLTCTQLYKCIFT